jgi:RNA polymerase sigma-70 factor (ECF subfamily)
LQAGIAACHCLAQDYAATDWAQILALYDQLLALNGSAVVALNRAVAVAQVHGAEAGLAALESIPGRADLEGYYLWYAVRGELEARRGNRVTAAECFRRAVELTGLPSERAFLEAQLQRYSEAVHPDRERICR